MERPYILVNVAMSADGKLDTTARKGTTLSSSADKARVDRLRAGMDAVLVGGRTLLDEDPKLTVKSATLRQERKDNGLDENPSKVGLVSLAELKLDGNFMSAGPARRLIYTTRRTTSDMISNLENAGAQVFVTGEKCVDIASALESLFEQGIRRIMIEGGGTIIAEFFRLGYVDELTMYVAPTIFGGANAPTLADGPGFQTGQAPILRLEAAEEFDDEGGVFLRYMVERKK